MVRTKLLVFVRLAKTVHFRARLSPSDQVNLDNAVHIIEAYEGPALARAFRKGFAKYEKFEPHDPEVYYEENQQEIDALRNEFENFRTPKFARKAAKIYLKDSTQSSMFLEIVDNMNKSFLKNGTNMGILALHEMIQEQQGDGGSRSRGSFRGSYGRRLRKRSKCRLHGVGCKYRYSQRRSPRRSKSRSGSPSRSSKRRSSGTARRAAVTRRSAKGHI